MNQKIFIQLSIIALAILSFSCQKDETLPELDPDAGPSYIDIENDGYYVMLGASQATEGQTGTWRIYNGENGRFDDVNDPKTNFYGEPGEKYVLGWELSRGSDYKASLIDVSFKKMDPVIMAYPSDTIFNNRSLWLEAKEPMYGATGLWEIVDGDGGRIDNAENNLGEFIGLQDEEYTLRWSLIYGSKKESLEFTFVTDTLQAIAGMDDLDIISSSQPKMYTLNAYLPAGATAKWEIIKGEQGKVFIDSNPNSLFEGVADTTYSIKWTVELDGEVSIDTVDVRFRGKWGMWTDARDKQTYRFATINGLEWMAENYNYAYAPGTGSWYYGFSDRAVVDNGTPVETEEDRKYYGRLYTWESAIYGAPEGWRLPTLEEVDEMLASLGGPLHADAKVKEGGESGLDLNYPGYLQRYSPQDASLRNVFGAQ
ncbi:MAG: hypothetical protein MI866_12140, partial [Bacteroidales bacterium]|nr:hypothetical protein [Bacteroidales bacterium]